MIKRILTILIIPAGIPGCASQQVTPWTPNLPVLWHDLATTRMEPLQGGYRILVRQPTSGLFPASLAVTRVAVTAPGDVGSRLHTVLLTDPRNEYLQWNSALDDQMAISEVFPIVKADMGGEAVGPRQILAAFRALGARLGLIYAVNELRSDETEVLGVLYDTEAYQPIAVLHAQATSKVPANKAAWKKSTLWDRDSHALVRAEFERLLHSCIHELIATDRPSSAAMQTGWNPSGRARSVAWPPR